MQRSMGLWVLLVSIVHSASAASHPNVAVVPAEPMAFMDAGDSRVWVRPSTASAEGGVTVLVRYAESFPAGEPVVLEVEIHCTENLSESMVTMELRSDDERVLAVGEQTLDLVRGINRCDFVWDPALLRDGIYLAHIYVYHPLRGDPPFRDLELIKVSEGNLIEDIRTAHERVEALRTYVPTHENGISSVHVRYGLASAYLPVAQSKADAGDWPVAQRVARYVIRTVDSIRAYLAFAPHVEALTAPAPDADMAAVAITEGSFFVGTRPLYLFGWNQGLDLDLDFSRAAQFGLNAVVAAVTPADITAPGAPLSSRLNRLFTHAQHANVGVSIMAPVNRAYPYSPADLTASMDPLMPVGFIAAHRSDARDAMQQYMETVLPQLQNRSRLLSVSLADKPAFRMDGPDVLAAFSQHVRSTYRDRLSVNRAWQTRFSSFDEIAVWWDNPSPAYQYDWQTFQHQAGLRFFQGLTELARRHLPSTPLQIQYAANMFQRYHTRLGIDHEALSRFTQISGCAVSIPLQDNAYALGYPYTAMSYAFLRSIAPEQPIYNTELRLWSESDPYMQYTFDQVYSAMWDGAIEGLDGSALAAGLSFHEGELRHPLYEHPESFEGYVMAGKSINRLAPIVHAFQTAPDEASILLSMPSLILNNGEPYVQSLVAAFEGASQAGRKVGFITEDHIRRGDLAHVQVLIIPNMTAISEDVFEAVNRYILNHGIVVRAGTTLPYDAHGHSRSDIVSRSLETVYLQESARATQFFHAMDAVNTRPNVAQMPHAINNFYYPIEAIKTRFVHIGGVPHLYLVNLRQEAEVVYLTGPYSRGHDLIGTRDVEFPMLVEPLTPMIVRMEIPEDWEAPTVLPELPPTVPTIPVTPLAPVVPANEDA